MSIAAGLRPWHVQPLDLRLWLVDLQVWPTQQGPSLDDDERHRAERFVFERDRRRYIAAHRALREVLASEAELAEGVSFIVGPYGKPALAQAGACRFNLSHSGDWALIGTAFDAEIGVDLELERPIEDLDALARQNFTEAERVELAAQSEPQAALRCFLSGWTRKEACLKALGSGLSIAPSVFNVGLAPTRRHVRIPTGRSTAMVEVESIALGPGMLAAVARLA
jgi:4'-phosphopantetheinyl transferase